MKKRFLALVLALMLFVGTFAAVNTTAFAATLGECDGVSGISTSDARVILRMAAQLEEITDALRQNADVDGDGYITTTDARITLRVAASLTTFEEEIARPTVTVPQITMEEKMLEYVNRERAAAGVPALTLNDELCANARVRSAEMAENKLMSHTRPNGSSCFTAVTVHWSAVGENIAMGYTSVDNVMLGWMNSEGHRANILASDFTQLGCAVAYDSSGYPYWTQIFIG